MALLFATCVIAGCRPTGSSSAPAAPAQVLPANFVDDWSKMASITPRNYVCGRATAPIEIDGKPDDRAWETAAWTPDFVDIEGTARPAPRFRTRAKMLWDDQYLYVLAQLNEPHVWGTITKQNQVIFHDPDFEIFIDPNGDHHNYYEFEMNALNTTWQLTLAKPYRDGGPAIDPTSMPGVRTAVHVDGTLNDPTNTDASWSVEVAIPWDGLKRYADGRVCPPKEKDFWRMNFSRVEWLVDIIDRQYRKVPEEAHREDNWVWSPTGVIDMHRPEKWAYVQFSQRSDAPVAGAIDADIRAHDALMPVYYRQRAFKERFGRYADTLADLGITASRDTGPGRLSLTAGGYVATKTVSPLSGTARTFYIQRDSKFGPE